MISDHHVIVTHHRYANRHVHVVPRLPLYLLTARDRTRARSILASTALVNHLTGEMILVPKKYFLLYPLPYVRARAVSWQYLLTSSCKEVVLIPNEYFLLYPSPRDSIPDGYFLLYPSPASNSLVGWILCFFGGSFFGFIGSDAVNAQIRTQNRPRNPQNKTPCQPALTPTRNC